MTDASANAAKHKVSFGLAASVFSDPLSATIHDKDHSEAEDRWITVGRAINGALLVVVHTWKDASPNSARVRIISARPATRSETALYEEGS